MSDNIKVAIRMRPLIARETEKNSTIYWSSSDSKYVFQVPSGSDKFCFDRVFDGKDDNWNVYCEIGLPIVQSIMQGFNGTIFAYGQTSSGKTYTMMGQHNGIYKGVIQYAIEDIFNAIEEMADREFLLRVSFLEIYNEKVYDLLSDKNEDLKLLEDSYGFVNVSGLEEKIVQTSDQIWEWLRKCQKKRRTGETLMNTSSSRSHFIFRMIIESRVKDKEDPVVNVSQLNLVDLAGSENVKQTKTKGSRFKEGIHINLSLSTLSQVISQLSEKDDQFINFRNSKLTRLLQNSIGGNALTAIICTVTPASLKETLSTFKFASRAKIIKNKPQKNEILNDQALLKQYANQIHRLSQQLEASKEQGKELEEKTKQNEDLKRQIEALKANFVSQTVINKTKTIRRETWGGNLNMINFPVAFLPPKNTFSSHLAILEEESEIDVDFAALSLDTTSKQSQSRSSSISLNSRQSILNTVNAETQTDPEFQEEIPGIEDAMMLVSELKSKLTSLQNEFAELNEYTTLEKQLLKADNELQDELEALKCENYLLKEQLEFAKKSTSVISKEAVPAEMDEVLTNICPVPEPGDKKMHNEAALDNSCLTNQLHELSFSSQKLIFDPKTKERTLMDISGSTLLDESLKSNFLAFYDECIENEVMAKLKSEIEALKYDIELKDKQIGLLNDKMQIKEQLIMSLNDEISLGQNIASHEALKISVMCQTGIRHSPKKCVLPKECQTSPLKPQSEANVGCTKCTGLNTFDGLNKSLLNAEISSSFGLGDGKNNQATLSKKFLSDVDDPDENADVLIEKITFEETINDNFDKKKMNEVPLSKSVIQAQFTQVTPKKYDELGVQCCKNETLDNYIQTSPIKAFEPFSGEVCDKVDEWSQVTVSFLEDYNKSLLVSDEKVNNLNMPFNQSVQTSPVVIKNIEDETDSRSFAEEEKMEKKLSQTLSYEMKIFIDKLNELKAYTIGLMKNCLKPQYLEDIDEIESDMENCSMKSVDEKVVFLKKLIERFEFYIKSKDDMCEGHSNQLESKFEEVITLELKLSEVEQTLKQREYEFSTLSKKLFNLHQRISELTSICRILNSIEVEDDLNSLKKSSNKFAHSEFNIHTHVFFIEELLVKLNSYVEENASKIINLNETLKKFESEMYHGKNCVDSYADVKNSLISKSVQTDHIINTINDTENEILFLKHQINDLKEANCKLLDNNEDLNKKIIDLEESYSAEIYDFKMQFEASKLEWNKKTRDLINDLEAKYEQELIDQQNKLTEELHGKNIEQKREHLKQIFDLEEKILNIKSVHGKEFLETKSHLEGQIKDLEEQLFSENSEKQKMKSQFDREKDQLIETWETKCYNITSKSNSRLKKCREINSQLLEKVKHYEQELEKLRKETISGDHNQQVERKLTDIINENNAKEKEYVEEIKKLQKNISHFKSQLKRISQGELKQNTCSNCKNNEEMNKKLLYDLDKNKAKIMSLEANNASLIQEIKKQNEIISSKTILCAKCKTNSRDLKPDIQAKWENHKEKKKSYNSEQKNDFGFVVENHATKKSSHPCNEYPKENDDPMIQSPCPDYVCIGGGSGPANMVKSYWLEGIIHKKDKEISKLKKQVDELNAEVKHMKMLPVGIEERAAPKKQEIVRTPVSPIEEINEDITIQTRTLHPYQGAVPKIQKRQYKRILKEKNGGKPYEQSQAAMNPNKEHAAFDWQYPSSSSKENMHERKKEDVVNVLTNPECKQQ